MVNSRCGNNDVFTRFQGIILAVPGNLIDATQWQFILFHKKFAPRSLRLRIGMCGDSIAKSIEILYFIPIIHYHKVLVWMHHLGISFAIKEYVAKYEMTRFIRNRWFTEA